MARAAVQKVRTTAYTHTESDHIRYRNLTALGTPLRSGPYVHSAAADWARWPCGTMFRIPATGEIYEVDDYGFALSGVNTIDLYKPTKRAMREWGVRRVTIEILKWGDPWASYRKMVRVRTYRHIRRMMTEIKSWFSSTPPPEPICPMPAPPTCQPCKPNPKSTPKKTPKKSPKSKGKHLPSGRG
jgi:3D (Asp-Asp-Asp) domain-containing protein